MDDDFLLLNPGPVPVDQSVLAVMSEPMISHRSAAFETIYERAQSGLDTIFTASTLDGSTTVSPSGVGTSLILNGTATMAMEAAVSNLVENDSTVLSLVNGKFGRRFKRIADRHASVNAVETTWGESIPMAEVEAALSDEIDVVTMVHNETSTGLLNPVEAVGELAAEYDAHFVVDGVTSIGGDEFRIDDWGVDVAVTDAQKALAIPPGISSMYATDSALAAFDGDEAPFYEDLDWYARKAEDHQTPFTSAVPLFRALAVSVENILEEGLPERIERHRRQASAFRAGFDAMGLEAFPEVRGPTELSNTVTAIALPEPVQADPEPFFNAVDERNVSISGGQAHLGGDIFRVSNMGNLSSEQILRGVRVVGEAMDDVGQAVDIEAGLEAARAEL